jgi:hypothetical protein
LYLQYWALFPADVVCREQKGKGQRGDVKSSRGERRLVQVRARQKQQLMRLKID